jgi:hypothetical protein
VRKPIKICIEISWHYFFWTYSRLFPVHFFYLRRVLTNVSRTSKPWNQNFCCLLYLADIENAPQDLQMELISLQCDNNVRQNFSEKMCKTFIPTCQKKSFCTQILLVKNGHGVREHLYVWTTSCPMNNNTMKIWSHFTDSWYLPWQWFPVICYWGQKCSPCSNSAKPPANLYISWGKFQPVSSLVILNSMMGKVMQARTKL